MFSKHIIFVNIFFYNNTAKLFNQISINEYFINKINSKKSLNKLIYNLKQLFFKILKFF